jgi:hypothetical protein
LDYERVGGAYEYFNLLFYGQVEHMEERAFSCFHLGIGSLLAKVLRGAVLRPLWTALVPIPGRRVPTPDPVRPDLAEALKAPAQLPGALRAQDWSFTDFIRSGNLVPDN